MVEKDPKFSEGARLERRAFRDKLRRELKSLDRDSDSFQDYNGLLKWVLDRQKRYDKISGGLGKR